MTVQDMPDTIEEKKLPLEHIRTDGGTQPRDGLIEDEVDEYVYQIGQKAKFPPIDTKSG
jgi:hypothetical protein